MEAEGNDVWDYYDKCVGDNVNDKRAKCRLCANIYNFNATIHNLKMHLQRKHSISVGTRTSLTKFTPQERPKRSKEVWNHFSQVEGKEKFASCHYCDKMLSYQTTTNNLKTHLRKQHPVAFNRLVQNQSSQMAYVEYLESETEEENSSDSVKQSSDLWGYFETENASTSICCVCCASVSSKPAELRRHLVTEHPKLMADYMSQDSDHNEEVYSEVIYLEENPKTKEQKIKVKKLDLDGYKRVKKRRISQEKQHTVEDEEIETFGSYITCLMKQLPRDVCSNVQREIINLIMNAKTQNHIKMETQQSLIKEIIKEMNCDDGSKVNASQSFDIVVEEIVQTNNREDISEKAAEGDQNSTEDKNDEEQ